MRVITGERLGTALRQLAEELVTERRHVAQLERENHELRHELEELRRSLGEAKVEVAINGLTSRS